MNESDEKRLIVAHLTELQTTLSVGLRQKPPLHKQYLALSIARISVVRQDEQRCFKTPKVEVYERKVHFYGDG